MYRERLIYLSTHWKQVKWTLISDPRSIGDLVLLDIIQR